MLVRSGLRIENISALEILEPNIKLKVLKIWIHHGLINNKKGFDAIQSRIGLTYTL